MRRGLPGPGQPAGASTQRDVIERKPPEDGAGQRPPVRLAPGVLAHHERPDRRLAIYAVVEATDVPVHEPQDHLVVVDAALVDAHGDKAQ